MDTLFLNLKAYSGDDQIEFERIPFKNFSYINIHINGADVLKDNFLGNGFLIFEELKKSYLNKGKYLIFTSISGIADDSGWNYVNVESTENSIKWFLEREDTQYQYEFEQNKYLEEIIKIDNLLMNLDKTITIEPSLIIFPE